MFSVVIPACNVGKYLEETLRSVKEQSFPAFECLIVCETSSDDTLERAKCFAASDTRFTVVELPVSGSASVSRNYGIAHAKEPWLIFLDGDDWLEAGAMEAVAQKISSHADADLIACEYRIHREGFPVRDGVCHRNPGRTLTGVEALTEFLTDGSYRSATWRNVYRTEWLRATGLRQSPGRRHQDDEWTPRVFCAASQVFVSGTVLCNYRKRGNSVTTDGSSRSVKDVAENISSMLGFVASGQLPDALMRQFARWQLRAVARFYSPIWVRLFDRELRMRELRRALRANSRNYRKLRVYACRRDRCFDFCRRVLPCRWTEVCYRWFYPGVNV